MNLKKYNLCQLKALQRAVFSTIQEMYYKSLSISTIEKEQKLLAAISEEIKQREEQYQNKPFTFDYTELWQLLHQCNISAFPTKEDNGKTLTL
jgi:hypothetical protein